MTFCIVVECSERVMIMITTDFKNKDSKVARSEVTG